jgi:hypothetical protein
VRSVVCRVKMEMLEDRGAFALYDGDNLLGYYLPASEFLFGEFKDKEVRILIEDTALPERLGFGVFNSKGIYKLEDVPSRRK